MLRNYLLISGSVVCVVHLFISPIPVNVQVVLLLAGIFIIGIPHGAADVLVASENASNGGKKRFSSRFFLMLYILRIISFGVLLWLFPLIGLLVFILFASYHFGETDLHFFELDSWSGKFICITYGLVIISAILFHNPQELIGLLQNLPVPVNQKFLQSFILRYHHAILSNALVLFFCSIFIYFFSNKNRKPIPADFLIPFTAITVMLTIMPLILGFTFYFVFWHSVISIKNIILYLSKNQRLSSKSIFRNILLYSVLAVSGILIVALSGSAFFNAKSALAYGFAGLAVLTAPHMEVMHIMYNHMRMWNMKFSNGKFE